MNGYDIFEAIGDIDPELIEKAERYVFKPAQNRRGIFLQKSDYLRFAAVAAVVLVIGVGVSPYLRMLIGGFGAAAGDTAPDEATEVQDTAAAQTDISGGLTGSAANDKHFPGFLDIYGSSANSGMGIKLETVEKSGTEMQLLTNLADTEQTAYLYCQTEITLEDIENTLPVLNLIEESGTKYPQTIRLEEVNRISIDGVEYSGSLDREERVGDERVRLDDYLYEEFCSRTRLSELLTRDEILACYEQAIGDTELSYSTALYFNVLSEPRKLRLDYKVTLKAHESVELRLTKAYSLVDMNIQELRKNIELLESTDAELDKDIAAAQAKISELDKNIMQLMTSSHSAALEQLDQEKDKKAVLEEQITQLQDKKAKIAAEIDRHRFNLEQAEQTIQKYQAKPAN